MSNPDIRPMSQHPEVLPLFAQAYREVWPAWYGDNGPGDATAFLRAACNNDGLPAGLLAFDDGQPAGTIVVSADSSIGKRYPGPWVSSLCVLPDYRGRGIGMHLVAAAECVAASLNFMDIYIGVTDLEAAILRRGYRPLGREVHDGQDVAILAARLQGGR